MEDKEKSRSLMAQRAGQMETAACGRAAISMPNSTTAGAGRQSLCVADFLNVGEAGAVPMRHLKAILHLDSRTIRQLIELERRQGAAILSNNRTGYYLAGDRAEIERFCASMRRRAFEIQRTAATVQLAAHTLEAVDDA